MNKALLDEKVVSLRERMSPVRYKMVTTSLTEDAKRISGIQYIRLIPWKNTGRLCEPWVAPRQVIKSPCPGLRSFAFYKGSQQNTWHKDSVLASVLCCCCRKIEKVHTIFLATFNKEVELAWPLWDSVIAEVYFSAGLLFFFRRKE